MNKELIERARQRKYRIDILRNEIFECNNFITGIESKKYAPTISVDIRPNGYAYAIRSDLGSFSKHAESICLDIILKDAKNKLKLAEKELEALIQ